jgi:hypothetical protein
MNEYKSISSINVNIFNGEVVKVLPITESGYNEAKIIKIPQVMSALIGNEYERRPVLQAFYQELDSVFKELKRDRKKRNGSVIFKALSTEINELSKSKADRKILIVNSDLMENSFLDFTNAEMIENIKNNPNVVEKMMTDKYPLNDLTGISVNIVYIPLNKTDSERFEVVSNLYNHMLSSRGAMVKISGNLN